mgnify:CR=1 FL=1
MIFRNHHARCDGLNNRAQVPRQQARRPGSLYQLTIFIEKMAQIRNESFAHLVVRSCVLQARLSAVAWKHRLGSICVESE